MKLVPLMLSATCMSCISVAAQTPVVITEETIPKISAREKWGLTMEQYVLINPSRRPNGDSFKYWKARKRGPYGNLLERVPGGPRRPVKF